MASDHQRNREAELRAAERRLQRTGIPWHDQQDLIAAAVSLVASVTARNAAHGRTFAVTVPRASFEALEGVLERVAPLRVAEQRDAFGRGRASG